LKLALVGPAEAIPQAWDGADFLPYPAHPARTRPGV
jgi:hypothetical protein